MIESNVLKRLLKNPHYKMTEEQKNQVQTNELDVELTTTRVVRKPKKNKSNADRSENENIRERSLSKENLEPKVQEVPDMQQPSN